MRKNLVVVVAVALLLSAATALAEDGVETAPQDSTEQLAAVSEDPQQSDQVVVYYLHMNRRCATCGKLEEYSKDAVEIGFAEQLKDSSLVFRVVNFEREGNEHFARTYQIYSQSLILSRQHNGSETTWKNLDKIWRLVGDKDEFIAYVRTEVASFMNPEETE